MKMVYFSILRMPSVLTDELITNGLIILGVDVQFKHITESKYYSSLMRCFECSMTSICGGRFPCRDKYIIPYIPKVKR